MNLTYDAVDAEGRRRKDRMDATSVQDAVAQLRRKGLFVTNIRADAPAARSPRAGRGAGTQVRHARLSLRSLALFTRQMAMLLRAGSSLVPALEAIRRQMKKPAEAAVLEHLVQCIEEGTTLAEGLRRQPTTFDATYCSIMQAGEASGSLAGMFERLALLVGKRKAMRSRLLGSMAYPALLIVMCANIMMVLLFFVLPRFGEMFAQLGAEVPQTTAIMLSIASALQHYWPVPLTLLAGLVAGVVWTVRSDSGRQWISNAQIHIPILGRLMGRLIQAEMFRTMGVLLESRVGVLEALDLSRGVTRNRRFQQLFDKIEEVVTAGGVLGSTFEESGLVEPFICQAIRTGEESGNLGSAIVYCADILDEINAELTGVIMKLIEPAILIGMGLVVGAVAISLFMPLFDLTSAAQ